MRLLSDVSHFTNWVIKLPLRGYQVEPLRSVLASVLHREGREFLLVFPRQSGKNEAVAQLECYLLNLFQVVGGNIVHGAVGQNVTMAMERLERRLDNVWNEGKWKRRADPDRVCLGRAQVVFLSTHPSASARGQTAHWLLVIDEAQSQDGPHIEAVFTPMRAAYNATALYIGTVKLTTDFLWQKKQQLERLEAADGCRRVFLTLPGEVTGENPHYQAFLDTQIRLYGRNHPIVASEYFLEPIDGTGGLFDERRRSMMVGWHPRRRAPEPGKLYVATLDVAGEDEGATDPIAALSNPARDYTVATVFEVVFPEAGGWSAGPSYHAVDVFVDHGGKHFGGGEEATNSTNCTNGVPVREIRGKALSLAERLLGWLEHWQVAHLVADESGVGLGLVSWLKAAMGAHRVTGYSFAAAEKKAALGSLFLALVETGRFKYWREEEATNYTNYANGDPVRAIRGKDLSLSDGWWFWQQVAACGYEVPAGGTFERHLRWGVPAAHRTATPLGPQPTHDDRLLSAALVAELDRLVREGKLALGRAESAVIRQRDPLGGSVY